jgi:hypothetical protein
MEARLRELEGLSLAGNAYHGVGIPDAILSGVRSAEKVWTDLTGEPTHPWMSEPAGSIASSRRGNNDAADSGHQSAAGLTQ